MYAICLNMGKAFMATGILLAGSMGLHSQTVTKISSTENHYWQQTKTKLGNSAATSTLISVAGTESGTTRFNRDYLAPTLRKHHPEVRQMTFKMTK